MPSEKGGGGTCTPSGEALRSGAGAGSCAGSVSGAALRHAAIHSAAASSKQTVACALRMAALYQR
jgi:hypothetical protein